MTGAKNASAPGYLVVSWSDKDNKKTVRALAALATVAAKALSAAIAAAATMVAAATIAAAAMAAVSHYYRLASMLTYVSSKCIWYC